MTLQIESHKFPPAGYERLRPRVMVVDDDPIIGCVLAGALNRGGCDVEIFHNSAEALDAFEHLDIDLAVVDWIMPDLDGIHLVDVLKAKSPDLPAMLITSYGEHEEIRAARTDGRFVAVLDKPFDLRHFIAAVQSCLKENAGCACNDAPKNIGSPDPAAAKVGSALIGRESFCEKMLTSIVDAIIMVDRQGHVVYHNRAAEHMFGFESRSAGLRFSELCPVGSQVPELMSGYFKPHAPVAEQNEALFQRADGEQFYTIYSMSPFDIGPRETAAILVIKDINERHMMAQQASEQRRDMEAMAITDPLTGLYNRRHFDRRLDEELKRVERYNSPLTLIMIDFDHFKQVNDRFGHLIGDKVLIAASRMLSKGLRDVDTLARWGGEEFMILMPETGVETGVKAAGRLHSLISDSKEWGAIAPGLNLTVSMGLINLPWFRDRMSADKVLSALDRALYKAKDGGRNQVVRYIESLDCFERI